METRIKRAATLPSTSTTSPATFNHSQTTARSTMASLSRPASYYDNIGTAGAVVSNGGQSSNGHNGSLRRYQSERLSQNYSQTNGNTSTSVKPSMPSQTVLLSTTVPQNIAATSNLATRHTPTRNSLRHSRMIVMTRTGKVCRKSMPQVIRYHRLAKALVGLQTLLASALCFLAMWLLLWAPNLRIRDNPYWSGIPLLLSGILGLILLCCCRKDYPGMPREYMVISTKVVSVALTAFSGAACLVASAFAIIHLVSLSSMVCTPANQLNSTCLCKVDSANQSQSPSSSLVRSYHYIDLSCPEVDNILSILLIFSCATNALAGVIALWYVYLHWASRYYYTYSKVRTKESNKPVVLTNA